jgi:hypothetical protein
VTDCNFPLAAVLDGSRERMTVMVMRRDAGYLGRTLYCMKWIEPFQGRDLYCVCICGLQN